MDKDRERKTSEAQLKASQKWIERNYKKFTLSMPTDEYSELEQHIQSTKETRNAFVRRSIKETIERDQQ